jgi:hypothetical protein
MTMLCFSLRPFRAFIAPFCSRLLLLAAAASLLPASFAAAGEVTARLTGLSVGESPPPDTGQPRALPLGRIAQNASNLALSIVIDSKSNSG